MPRSGQIIPEYTQPHEEVYINDNTYYEDTTSDNSGPTFLCVFAGGKGRSDRLILEKSFSKFVTEFGLPDYRKWGQPMYMPYVALYTGNAKCQCLRITADDATFANLILVVGYKQEAGKLKLKFKTYARSNLRSIDDLEAFAATLETSAPDADGYMYMPIMRFWSLGKGEYGNNFRIRISHDKNADKENDYKNYRVELLSTEDGAKKIESYNVTFFIDATDPNTKLTSYVDEIVNDEGGKGSERVGCAFEYDNFSKLFDEYKKVYANNGYIPPTVEDVDRLPSIITPSTTTLFHLTADDGTKKAGDMYVYDATAGKFVQSAFSVSDVASLPPVNTASLSIVYKLTADDATDSTKKAGTSWITTDNAAWTPAMTITDVNMLPDPRLYTAGVVYKLTRDIGGTKVAGSEWIFNATANDYIAYVSSGPSTPDPLLYTLATFDIFGYNRFTKADDQFIVFDGGKESIHIMDIEGIALATGDDGAFSMSKPSSEREQAMNRAYINAFQGVTDKKVLSKRRAPVDILLDACHSIETKKAMVSLALQRMDLSVRLDCGLISNVSDLYDIGDQLNSIDTFVVSKNAHMFKTTDPVTGKQIPVSITMWMAQKYPLHFLTKGNHVPMAGENNATLSGYVKNSIRPCIDADDMDVKEKLLTEYKINYVEAIDEDTYIRGTQETSQVKSSDLSEENNVFVLLEIKRKIERMAGKRRYEWSEEDDLRIFKENCDEIFSSYRGTKCKTLTIKVAMSAWEKTRYIVHVYLSVVFRTFQKRAIIEIDVNPRT